VELERLVNVLYVGRPAFGQEQSTVGLFKVDQATGEAERVQVQLGRSSVNTIEVMSGLRKATRWCCRTCRPGISSTGSAE
jgi:HlyD family secretion protein